MGGRGTSCGLDGAFSSRSADTAKQWFFNTEVEEQACAKSNKNLQQQDDEREGQVKQDLVIKRPGDEHRADLRAEVDQKER